MANPAKGNLDSVYSTFIQNDFSGGMNVNTGALALSKNEVGYMQNCFPLPGRCQFRGGWTVFSTIPAAADMAYAFYDSTGAKHFVVWAGGSVYDVVSGTPVTVESSVYTAGQDVGVCDISGVLYWSTTTVPIRFWNPVTATKGALTATGSSPVPAARVLTVYTGSIVAGDINFGTGEQANVFAWSATNAPGNWTAANSQAVGSNNGGHIEFIREFGISEIGVDPFRTLIVGRNDIGIYAYSGALGSLTEAVINCPVGCWDGNSVQYLPSAQMFGTLVFMGTDAQIWATNGITASPVSTKVLPLLSSEALSQAALGANPRFYSGYNQQWQYYFCSAGSLQFVYKWDTGAWAVFTGWPIGPVFQSTNASGVPQLYATSGTQGTASPLVVAQIALPAVNDNGSPPSIYVQTAYIYAGNPGSFKEFHWVNIHAYNTGTAYSVVAMNNVNPQGYSYTTNTLTFSAPLVSSGSNLFILNQSLLNGPNVLAGSNVAPLGIGNNSLVVWRGRLVVPYTLTGELEGRTGATVLFGSAIQVTVSWASGAYDFELVAIELQFIDKKGYLRVGNALYNPANGVPSSFDIYAPPQSNPTG